MRGNVGYRICISIGSVIFGPFKKDTEWFVILDSSEDLSEIPAFFCGPVEDVAAACVLATF